MTKVGFPACRKLLGLHQFHCVGEKYLNAVVDVVEALPVLIPALSHKVTHDNFLDEIDGLVLTGSYSNIEPHHYQEQLQLEGSLSDSARDKLTLGLIRRAVDKNIPVLGICRGFQEINVALGGSLHQQVHTVDLLNDHREDKSLTLEQQYDISHPIDVVAGGVLASIWPESKAMVNSLHGQGANRLAPGLKIEATAPDGLVEAISLPGKPLLGVEWHPEWRVQENDFYQRIFLWFKQQVEINAQNRV